jgi:hypothetical protein
MALPFNGEADLTIASQWDASQWGSLVLAPGDPDSDAIDRLHTLRDFSKMVDRPLVEIVDAIERGKLQSICKGDRTVSMRMWADYLAKEETK